MTIRQTRTSTDTAAFDTDAMYIDGQWCASVTGRTEVLRSPYDRRIVAEVPRGDAEGVLRQPFGGSGGR